MSGAETHTEAPAPNDFGWAVKRLKEGKRVARKGWNGKGMWLWHVEGDWNGHIAHAFPNPFIYLESLPFIAMKTADDKLIPWLSSQADVLAEDWELVE